jgi:uncharacterized membrane protein YfcA
MLHMPMSGVEMAWWPLLLIGFTVGVVGGYFGLGGAWLVTPALNLFGFPMVYAVGTDMAHVAGKSVVSTFRHWRFGHVSVIIALTMLIGTMAGVEVGAQTLMFLNKKGLAGPVVRYIYMVLLFGMFFFMLKEYLAAKKSEKITGKEVKDLVGNRVSRWIQNNLNVWPVIYCKTARMRISVWALIFLGIFTGFVAGILGIGGGLLRVPALIYLVGVPTKIAVGTDLFEVMFSGAYGGFTYGAKGMVELLAASIMLCGAAVGAQFGTICTKYVYGITIRLVYAICCFFAFTSVVLKQVASGYVKVYEKGILEMLKAQGITGNQAKIMIQYPDQMQNYMLNVAHRPDWWQAFQTGYTINMIGCAVIMTAACGVCSFIIYLLVKGIMKEKREKRQMDQPVQSGA